MMRWRRKMQTDGALQSLAAKLLMKVLYSARMMRFDLLKAIAL